VTGRKRRSRARSEVAKVAECVSKAIKFHERLVLRRELLLIDSAWWCVGDCVLWFVSGVIVVRYEDKMLMVVR
jgi:hypothetical protein